MRYVSLPTALLACALAANAARAEDGNDRKDGGGAGFTAGAVSQAPLPLAGIPTAVALLVGAGLTLRRRRSGSAA